jgi:Domain of unknown function (DUF4276)
LSRLRVVPIVEGHGENESIRILLQRLWTELLHGEYVEVLQPIRSKRLKLVQAAELERALDLAVLKARAVESKDPWMILVLLDADDDPPCIPGPELLSRAKAMRADADIACVIANVEYETWFVAAAQSLSRFLDLSEKDVLPETPEWDRQGKAWIRRRFTQYKPTADQPALTQAMDLTLCRSRSPSFDKLCRELEARLRAGTP